MKCSASYILKARITQLGRGRVLLAPHKPKTSSWLECWPKGLLPVPGAACCPCGSVTLFLLPSSCSISFFLRGVGEEGKGIGFRAPPFQTAWFYFTRIRFWAPHFQTARFYLPKSENDGQQIMLWTFQVCTFIKHESNPWTNTLVLVLS